jgi:hypothetical protein
MPASPPLRDLLTTLGRIGARAFAAAAESVADDVDAAAEEVGKRAKRAKKKIGTIRQSTRRPPVRDEE